MASAAATRLRQLLERGIPAESERAVRRCLTGNHAKKKLTAIAKVYIAEDPDGTLAKKQLDVIVRLLERAHQEAARDSRKPRRRVDWAQNCSR